MRFFSEDIVILKALMREDTVGLYDLHEHYLLSPGQIARSLQKLKDEGVIEYNSDRARLNDFGKEWILTHRKQMFLQPKERLWSEIREDYRPQINIQELPPVIKKKDIIAIIEDGQ